MCLDRDCGSRLLSGSDLRDERGAFGLELLNCPDQFGCPLLGQRSLFDFGLDLRFQFLALRQRGIFGSEFRLELEGVEPDLNRPGFLGGSRPWKRGWSYATRIEVRASDSEALHRH